MQKYQELQSFEITIDSIQWMDHQKESEESIYRGTGYSRGDKHYIHYTEYMEGQKVSTLIIFSNHQVRIKRSGAVSSEMIFRLGEKTAFVYTIAEGSFEMGIDTEKLIFDEQETSGSYSLEIYYNLVMYGETVSHHKICIGIKKCKNQIDVK